MKVTELKEKIESFYTRVKQYRDLLLESRDAIMPEIVRNHDVIEAQKSQLLRDHAKLRDYILKFGKNPQLTDGVWNIWFSPYDNAFTSDTLVRVGPSIDAVIEDLDFAIGRLEALNGDAQAELPSGEKGSSVSDTSTELDQILARVDAAINFAEQKLLKGEELNDLVKDLRNFEPPEGVQDIPKRRLERIKRDPNTVWTNEKGYATGGSELLNPWREVLLELGAAGSSVSQKYFRPGSRDELINHLKPLIAAAKRLRIYDNYLGEEILKLIESTALDAEIMILGGGGQVDSRFETKLPAFVTYFGKNVEARKSAHESHARFYIVDDLVYHVDPSLKGKGADRATIISPVEKSEAVKIISDFEDWWSKAQRI